VKRSVVVGALGTAQTLAWGSSYYLPAIVADPIAHGLGILWRTADSPSAHESVSANEFRGCRRERRLSEHDRWGETSIMRDAAARGVVKNASRWP
jgi:hypothetical protein